MADLMGLKDTRKADLIQKSRFKWALDGDENSKFFHGIVTSNVASNRIHGLMIEGMWITDPEIIKKHYAAHFRDRFTYTPWDKPAFFIKGIKRISSEEADVLMIPFTALEIKSAVWECDGNKAPGPDGFNLSFIKRYWGLLEADFLDVFKYFHNTGVLTQHGMFFCFYCINYKY